MHLPGVRVAKRWLFQEEGGHVKHVGDVCITCMQDPPQCVPDLWGKRPEGHAGAKGHLFLLSHTVALNSETDRVPNSNLAFQKAMKVF